VDVVAGNALVTVAVDGVSIAGIVVAVVVNLVDVAAIPLKVGDRSEVYTVWSSPRTHSIEPPEGWQS
jgi:hypothetical protein